MAKAGRCREPGPPPAAILQSLTGGAWGTQTLGCLCSFLAPVPLERLLPQAGQSLLLSATFLLLRLYFNKKSSYHAGRLLYSSSGELALLPRVPRLPYLKETVFLLPMEL